MHFTLRTSGLDPSEPAVAASGIRRDGISVGPSGDVDSIASRARASRYSRSAVPKLSKLVGYNSVQRSKNVRYSNPDLLSGFVLC